MIKGLGYGTDPVLLGRLLEAQNVDWLAVAYADEGVVLREAGIRARILVLNPDPSTFGTMHAHALEPQLVSSKHVQLAKEWAQSKGPRLGRPPQIGHRNAPSGVGPRRRCPR